MAGHKDDVIEKLWPLFQSLTLVRAPIKRVAKALLRDMRRRTEIQQSFVSRLWNWDFGHSNDFETKWFDCRSLEDLVPSVPKFTYSDCIYYALPTRSQWTVIWTNGALCSDDHSLCWCLAKFHGLQSITFQSTDRNSIMLAGTKFEFFDPEVGGDNSCVRSVYCCNQGCRWHFEQSGEPLSEEDTSRYELRRKRDRLNEVAMMELLERFGARPWREDFYDFAHSNCFSITDARNLATFEAVSFEAIRERAIGGAQVPEQRDEVDFQRELKRPPDYLDDVCVPTSHLGPAKLIAEQLDGVDSSERKIFDVMTDAGNTFRMRLAIPESQLRGNPPFVELAPSMGGESFCGYDARRHPASVYADSRVEPRLDAVMECPNCSKTGFHVSIGFALHSESGGRNDTSRAFVAAECTGCGWSALLLEDET